MKLRFFRFIDDSKLPKQPFFENGNAQVANLTTDSPDNVTARMFSQHSEKVKTNSCFTTKAENKFNVREILDTDTPKSIELMKSDTIVADK